MNRGFGEGSHRRALALDLEGCVSSTPITRLQRGELLGAAGRMPSVWAEAGKGGGVGERVGLPGRGQL